MSIIVPLWGLTRSSTRDRITSKTPIAVRNPLDSNPQPMSYETCGSIAERLSTRGDNDMVLLPYNPGAMSLYITQSGSITRKTKLKWVNSTCPCQPGITECGYYVIKFMKEIGDEGLDLLVKNNVGGRKNEYVDADLDEIREEWSRYVLNFIYTRGDNDMVLLPYNPGNDWVLAVLDMKTSTCYYLDSLRAIIINSLLKQFFLVDDL